ncbi:hypothetical protein F1654_07835 [Alkalicaulis satelles]|uniref:Uncharacterized protein n=1 Tax=Alkalicaulis satelles TaxID=2609175 RepID=A0A5M6ZG42_9PROT|nr:hypothetical protein [Alkalicaulis satelles]KAA5803703.1 hypothetical protein F1654_07835 [Alkalicaulis satelles]
MGLIRIALAWIAAAAFMAVAGTMAQSAFVLADLAAIGAPLGAGDITGHIAHDLAGLAPLYGALIAIAFLIAFPAGVLAARLTRLPRALVLGAAGLTAMAVMLALMEPVFFGVQPIAGARSLAGQGVQALLGLISGLIFAGLTPRREKSAI